MVSSDSDIDRDLDRERESEGARRKEGRKGRGERRRSVASSFALGHRLTKGPLQRRPLYEALR